MGKRVLFDHCHVSLKGEGNDWGPKPFRFNNFWFKHKEFSSFVNKEWSLWKVKERGDYGLYENMKNLKFRLNVWNKETFRWIDLKV